MIFNDKMCTSGQLHRPQQLTNLVDPFSFSALHLLRTYNRLLAPTDVAQCYNLTLMKDHGIQPSGTSTGTNSATSGLLIDKNNFQLHPLSIIPKKLGQQIDLSSEPRQLIIQCDLNESKLHGTYDCHSPSNRIINTSCRTASSPELNNYKLSDQCFENGATMDNIYRDRSSIDSLNGSISGRRQRGEKRPIPDEQKDEKYYERRKRNNEAAKKSRDARKIREDRIAFRAAMLEQENAILRAQLVALREEITTLRQMLCVRTNSQISL